MPPRSARSSLRILASFASLLGLWLATPALHAADRAPAPDRAIPADDVAAFAEFEGLDAHAPAWNATAAHALLNQTDTGALMIDLAGQLLDRLLRETPGAKLTGPDVLAIQEHVARRGFSFASYRHAGGATSWVLVLHGAGGKPACERFERLLRAAFDANGKAGLGPKRIRSREVSQLADDTREKLLKAAPFVANVPMPAGDPNAPWLSWWSEADALIVVANPSLRMFATPALVQAPRSPTNQERVDAVLDALEGRRPNVATHPGYLAALAEGKDLKGFEPDGLVFLETVDTEQPWSKFLETFATSNRLEPGITLPTGKFMRDDVQYFPPDLAFPWANTQAATQRARMRAMGMEMEPPLDLTPSDEDRGSAPPRALAGQATPPTPAAPSEIAPGARPHLPMDLPAAPPRPAAGAAAPPRPAPPKEIIAVAGPEPPAARDRPRGTYRRIVGRWGFQGRALMTVLRLESPKPDAEAKGNAKAGPTGPSGFAKDRLPFLPKSPRDFAIGTLDAAASYPKLLGWLEANQPQVAEVFTFAERSLQETAGLRLRDDLLHPLGPTWGLVELPAPVGDGRHEAEPDYVLLAQVRDPDAFIKTLDTLAERLNRSFREEANNADPDRAKRGPAPAALALERLEAPARGYRLTSPAGLVFSLGSCRPTIQVGHSMVAFALHPDHARAALASEAAAPRPDADLAEALAPLPGRLDALLTSGRNGSFWPEVISQLPALAQWLGSTLEAPDETGPRKLLDVLGIPRPGAFRINVDPAHVPRTDDLRPFLFPSVFAATTDERGTRLILREAFPFVALGDSATLKHSVEWTNDKGFKQTLKLKFGPKR